MGDTEEVLRNWHNMIMDDPEYQTLCYHVWKQYIGFTKIDWYCEKCLIKTDTKPFSWE